MKNVRFVRTKLVSIYRPGAVGKKVQTVMMLGCARSAAEGSGYRFCVAQHPKGGKGSGGIWQINEKRTRVFLPESLNFVVAAS